MKKYKHVFFDLDRTLWDFERNSSETVQELFTEHNLEKELGIDFSVFYQSFLEINAASWRDFRKGEQSKEELRSNRFVKTFFRYGSDDWKKARELSRLYIEICPYKNHLIDGASDLLQHLSEREIKMHIITNGFSDTQRIKIKSSGLEKYLDQVIISDDMTVAKPDRRIFLHALKKSGARDSESLMVGDDYKKDIEGARRAGIHQAHLNPEEKLPHNYQSTYVIRKLIELKEIAVD